MSSRIQQLQTEDRRTTVAKKLIVADFDRRSRYYTDQSPWTIDNALNEMCRELVFSNIEGQHLRMLDYGAGPGALGKIFSRSKRVKFVDVSDISQNMLDLCDFARHKFHLPREQPTGPYEAIILRQVIQYLAPDAHANLIKALKQMLSPSGVILVSQITPHFNHDFHFWKQLLTIRRPTRQSFPDSENLITSTMEAGLTLVDYAHSETAQLLSSWTMNESSEMLAAMKAHLASADETVRNTWRLRQLDSGDFGWQDHWIHLVAQML